MTISPYHGTKTERKRLRRDIRWYLGTSREDPPSVGALMNAVTKVNALVHATTGGRVSLVVMDNRTNGCVNPWTVGQAANEGDHHIEQAGGLVLNGEERRTVTDLLYEWVPQGKIEENRALLNKLDHTIPEGI